MMKRHFISFIIIMISLSVYTKSYAQDEVAREIVTPFLNALKSGDTAKMLQYTDGPLYKRNKVLVNQNNNYTDFLKAKYEKVKFLINKISAIDNEKLVADILFIFPDGSTTSRKLILRKNEDSNSWKIIDEIRSKM